MKQDYDVICIGMALIDSIIKGFDPNPVSASGYRAESGSLFVGGEAVNEAVTAAKLGLRAAILCSLGRDDAGEMVLHSLKAYGVDTSLVVRSDGHPTPVTTMFVRSDGTRKSITNHSHAYNFHPEQYVSAFERAGAVILGSLFRAPFDDPDVIEAVLTAAKKNGLKVFADTKLPNFRTLTLEDLRGALPLMDYITPNEDEAKYYTKKETPEEMADVFLSYGVPNVIIKLGGKGCLFKNAGTSCFLPALSVHAVDATGAGDHFIAGFASEILRGNTPEGALRFANACGAVCASSMGALTGLKNREQVMSLLR